MNTMQSNGSFLKPIFVILAAVALLAGCSAAHQQGGHNSHDNVLAQYVFTPAENVEQQIDETLNKAHQQQKLAIIVLGAQWCHDSRGLAANFSTPAMQEILQEKFETLFVDVGFLKDRRNITKRFGYPAYFATPTVLVVNPETQELLNQSSLSIWQAADSVDFDLYQQHFSDVSSLKPVKLNVNHPSYQDVVHFTERQVDRLHNGYAVLGPMLQADVEGQSTDKAALQKLWAEVRKFRMTLQSDIHALREQLATQSQDSLALPTYPKQSWEQSAM